PLRSTVHDSFPTRRSSDLHLFTTGQITESMIDKLKRDERKGVQKLVKAYETNKAKEKALKEKFAQMCRYENKHYSNGLRFIAGVDRKSTRLNSSHVSISYA